MSWHPDEAYDATRLVCEEAAEVISPEAVITRLKLAVADAGSLSAFARAVGCAKSSVSEALSGRRQPTPAILSALGVRRAIVGGRS